MVGWSYRQAQELSKPGLEKIVGGSAVHQCMSSLPLMDPLMRSVAGSVHPSMALRDISTGIGTLAD